MCVCPCAYPATLALQLFGGNWQDRVFGHLRPGVANPFHAQIYGRTFVLTDADEWAKKFLADLRGEEPAGEGQ